MMINKYSTSAIPRPLKHCKGFIFFAVPLLLCLLSTAGVVSVINYDAGRKITDKYYESKAAFYIAESAWREGAMWLETRPGPVLIRDANEKFDQHQKGIHTGLSVNNYLDEPVHCRSASMSGIPYWFKIDYLRNESDKNSGSNYRRFLYRVTSRADDREEIDVILFKTFKVGY